MRDYLSTEIGAVKAADKSAKNLVKKVLLNHAERFLLIDNETILPIHWSSYYAIAHTMALDAVAIGVDVYPPIDSVGAEDQAKLNLQTENRELFIASVYKYFEVKSELDFKDVLLEIRP